MSARFDHSNPLHATLFNYVMSVVYLSGSLDVCIHPAAALPPLCHFSSPISYALPESGTDETFDCLDGSWVAYNILHLYGAVSTGNIVSVKRHTLSQHFPKSPMPCDSSPICTLVGLSTRHPQLMGPHLIPSINPPCQLTWQLP